MARFSVGIAVNGTVYLPIEADNAAEAEAKAAQEFSGKFKQYVQQVDPKSCYIETVENEDESE